MSVWGDILDRGTGVKERKENLIPDSSFSELYPNVMGLADQIHSVKENSDRLKKELNKLKEQLRRL